MQGQRTSKRKGWPTAPADARANLSNAVVFETYLKKGVGIDMLLKLACYTCRLWSVWARNDELRDKLTTIVGNIVNARMQLNICRYLGSLVAMKKEWDAWSPTQPKAVNALSVACFLFRSCEQIAGDLGYVQKHLVQHWNKTRLVWHYKFWKSLSLTCSAIVELYRTISFWKEWVELGAVQKETGNATASTSESTMCALKSEPSFRMLAASPAPDSLVAQRDEREDETMHIDQIRRIVHGKMLVSLRNFVKAFCDMIIYYQWVDGYKPYPTLAHSCGVYSAVVGVYMTWAGVVDKMSDAK